MSEYKEPWRAEHGVLQDATGKRIPELYEDGLEYELAVRIAACVNFCAGISTETLNSTPPMAGKAAT